eukprot:380174-Pyramimonas_sp.AAC.1
MESLRPLGISGKVIGGGRIEYYPDKKSISIYGYATDALSRALNGPDALSRALNGPDALSRALNGPMGRVTRVAPSKVSHLTAPQSSVHVCDTRMHQSTSQVKLISVGGTRRAEWVGSRRARMYSKTFGRAKGCNERSAEMVRKAFPGVAVEEFWPCSPQGWYLKGRRAATEPLELLKVNNITARVP